MIFESLTAGCSVGLLEMTPLGSGRVSDGIGRLVGRGWVTRFADWRRGGRLASPRWGFNEAARCAEEIIGRWFPQVPGDGAASGKGPC